MTVNEALAPRPTGIERLTEAAISYANAPDDDEGEFKRARDNLRKAAMSAQSAMISEWVKEALAKRKADGVRLGRPPLLSEDAVREALDAGFTTRTIAARLGVSKRTVFRLKRKLRAVTESGVSGT